MSRPRIAAVVVVVLLVACGIQPEPGNGGGSSAPRPTFGEHRPSALSANPTRKLGEDCTEHGADECLSHRCLHTGASPTTGYLCTEACGPASPCPDGWRCVRVHPSTEASVCLRQDSGGKP